MAAHTGTKGGDGSSSGSGIVHERAAIDAPKSTPATSTTAETGAPASGRRAQGGGDTSHLSELERHKIQTGRAKLEDFPPAPPRTAQETPQGDDDADEGDEPEGDEGGEPGAAEGTGNETPDANAGAEKPESKAGDTKDVDARDRFVDPDTGEAYDMRRRPSRRIKALLGDRAALREENRQLREQLARMSASPDRFESTDRRRPAEETRAQGSTDRGNAAADPNDPEPVLADFGSYEEYNRAVTRWEARQEFRAEQRRGAEAGERQRRQEEFRTNVEKFRESAQTVRQKYADFDEKIRLVPVVPETQWLTRALVGSPIGAELTYYLGSNPEELDRIMSAPTLEEHMRAIGRVEAKVQTMLEREKNGAPRVSRAPEPISPVSTNRASGGADAGDAGESEYQKHRRARGMPLTGR